MKQLPNSLFLLVSILIAIFVYIIGAYVGNKEMRKRYKQDELIYRCGEKTKVKSFLQTFSKRKIFYLIIIIAVKVAIIYQFNIVYRVLCVLHSSAKLCELRFDRITLPKIGTK